MEEQLKELSDAFEDALMPKSPIPKCWKHGQKFKALNVNKEGIVTLNIAPDCEYWFTNDQGKIEHVSKLIEPTE